MNVADDVSRVAMEDPDRTALLAAGERWSYIELLAAATAEERALEGAGVGPGDRVVCMLPNSVTFIAVYLACLRRGYVLVPLAPTASEDEIRHVLADSGAAAVVVLDEVADAAPAEGADQVGPLRRIQRGRTVPRPGAGSLRAAQRSLTGPLDLDPAWPALLLYTSGTTGRPKGALLSHRNVRFVARSKVRYLGLHHDDVLLLFLPLHHCFGLNAVLTPGLHAGAAVVVSGRFEREQTLRLIRRHGVTRLFAVPQAFRMLLDAGVSGHLVPSVRYAMSAGDTLPDDLHDRWERRMGWPIHQAYGLTEASPFVTYNHQPRLRPGSVGTAIDGVRVQIRRCSGEPAPRGETGEVWVRGPNVMLGYWNAPGATADAMVDGWLRTADHGRLDEDGYLYLAGRSNELIIVRGHNVYAAEVERVLRDDERVLDAAVYGVQHDLTGEVVCASVVPSAAGVDAQALRARCARHLAAYKVPVMIDLVDALPTGRTGKTDRRALAAQARARRAYQAGPKAAS
ncbi:class I adenylate-forming enzyme family protein [Phytoactinopolyspora halotolerans]|nr:AMP-binding protein [Phytoactinopolyspora halotolerans]